MLFTYYPAKNIEELSPGGEPRTFAQPSVPLLEICILPIFSLAVLSPKWPFCGLRCYWKSYTVIHTESNFGNNTALQSENSVEHGGSVSRIGKESILDMDELHIHLG